MNRRKVFSLFLVLALFLSLVPSVTAKSFSPLSNLDFEEVTSDEVPFEGWDSTNSNSYDYPTVYTVQPTTDHVSSGATALNLKATFDDTSDPAKRGQSIKIKNERVLDEPLKGDVVYNLSFDMDKLGTFTDVITASVDFCTAYPDGRPNYDDCMYSSTNFHTSIDSVQGYQTFRMSNTVANPSDNIVHAYISFTFRKMNGSPSMELDAYIDNIKFTIDAPSMADGEGSQNMAVGVNGGTLDLETTTVSFSSVDLDVRSTMDLNSTVTIRASDSRGNSDGWAVKMSSTDFTSEVFEDKTSEDDGTLRLKIPVSQLSATYGTVTPIGGQQVHPTHGPIAGTAGDLSQTLTVFKAEPGFGMGDYSLPINLNLHIPLELEIVELSSTTSAYSLGEFIGAREGTYTATLTFIIGTGI